MQINKIYGNMNFGLKNSGQSKYTRDPRSTKTFNKQAAANEPFYRLTKQGNLPQGLKNQLSAGAIENIEGILEDIKNGKINPNIISIAPTDVIGEKFNEGIQQYLEEKNKKELDTPKNN